MEDILEEDLVPSFRVILSSRAAAKMRDGIPRASAAERGGLGLPYTGLIEAGGLMVGEHVGENAFRVTDVSLTIGEPNRYYLDPADHESFVGAFRAKCPDAARFGLIGSWHSHPSGEPQPSARDLQTLKATMAHPSTDLAFKVLLIVCRDTDGQLQLGGVVLTREPKVLSRIHVFIEADPDHAAKSVANNEPNSTPCPG